MTSTTTIAPTGLRFTLWRLLVFVTLLAMLCGAMVAIYNWGEDQREHGRHMVMCSHFKQQVLAIHNYHADQKVVPQAVTYNANHELAYGWRTSLLDYLEAGSLFAGYDKNAAWNSIANANHCNLPLELLQRPKVRNKVANATNIVAVTGPGTLFPDDRFTTFADVTDDPATTIMLVEIDNSDILGYEPRDLHIHTMSFLINDPDRSQPCMGNRRAKGAWVGMVDGSVKFIPENTPPETLKAMLTIAGGETISLPGGEK